MPLKQTRPVIEEDKRISLKNLQIERGNRYDEVTRRDKIKVSWLYPRNVNSVEIFSGQFKDLDWANVHKIIDDLNNCHHLKSVDLQMAQLNKSRIELDVLEDDNYDLIFVPITIDEQGKKESHILESNILWNNSKRRRTVYYSIWEDTLPISKMDWRQPILSRKICNIEIGTEEKDYIPKEAIGIRVDGRNSMTSLDHDFNYKESLEIIKLEKTLESMVTIFVNDGYHSIRLERKG